MRKLDQKDIKKYSFEVLCDIHEICEKHDISYSLTGGTLIGSIRHNGFIPWDDDIDIMMSRKDYDKFINIVKEGTTVFRLLANETCGSTYNYPFAKACHKKTVLIENGIENCGEELGVYVDIFPVDGAGNSYILAKLYSSTFQILHGLKLMSCWTKYRKSKLRKWYFEPPRLICYYLSKCIGTKIIDKCMKKYIDVFSFENSKYAGRLVGDYGNKEIMSKYIFDIKIDVIFENKKFKAIAEYDTFLRNLYGDYMCFPPVEKQVTHHDFIAYEKIV